MDKENRRLKQAQSLPSVFDPQDDDERELERMFRDGTIEKAIARGQKKNLGVKLGAQTIATKVPVTMRLDKLTLLTLQDQARREGLRYQSLINSVLLKYITGQLVERKK